MSSPCNKPFLEGNSELFDLAWSQCLLVECLIIKTNLILQEYLYPEAYAMLRANLQKVINLINYQRE